MVKLLFYSVLIFISGLASAQINCHITGSIPTIENGYVKFTKGIESNQEAILVLYQGNQFPDSIPIRNHQFTISGHIQQPGMYRLFNHENQFITELFFVDTGKHQINIQETTNHNPFDVGWGITVSNSAAQDAFIQYLSSLNSVNTNILTLYDTTNCENIQNREAKKVCNTHFEWQRNIYRNQRDSILTDYIIRHPNASINPWILYWNMDKMGYRAAYTKLLEEQSNLFPKAIHQVLSNFLLQLRKNTIGESFPLLHFIEAKVPEWKHEKPLYTLIDFWFSSCSPCIAQFELLKPIYKEYHSKGFEIIAITTDAISTLQQYKAVLKKQNYQWKLCIDTNGKRAKSIYIKSYPSNFLINQQGKIVAVDIRPERLEAFLKDELL
jgi:thiol-disulfide isomerase/thioredoxin